MYKCITCGEITNLNFSLCQLCYDKTREQMKKKYNWPFSRQFIRFDN